jgi:hypothetical protein
MRLTRQLLTTAFSATWHTPCSKMLPLLIPWQPRHCYCPAACFPCMHACRLLRALLPGPVTVVLRRRPGAPLAADLNPGVETIGAQGNFKPTTLDPKHSRAAGGALHNAGSCDLGTSPGFTGTGVERDWRSQHLSLGACELAGEQSYERQA